MNHSKLLAELSDGKSGVIDMDVNGMPCTVYYGPIEHVAWSVAVIVPSQDKYLPVEIVGIAMLLLALAGMIVVWLAYRRITYETAT
jgi:fructose-specific phosphotransferase system IIC component